MRRDDTFRAERTFRGRIRGDIEAPERFDWAFTERDYYHDASMLPNLDALTANVAMMKDLGFVRSSIEVQKYSDLSIVKEAAARLR